MLFVISPAKKQNFDTPAPTKLISQIHFGQETATLAKQLRDLSPKELSQLMSISEKLGQLNFQRYDAYDPKHYTLKNSKQALFAFQGDVYKGLAAETLEEADLQFAQDHLVILSGLYGALRPLDLIQPHRLEMGTKLATEHGNNLYEFWGDKITAYLNQLMRRLNDEILINLASCEYFKAVHPESLAGRIINIDFKEKKGKKYKIVGIHAKRARGMMARFIIQGQINQVDGLKAFDQGDYQFNEALSETGRLVFTR